MIEVSVIEGFVSVLSLCVRVKEKDVVKKCLFLPDVGHSGCSYFTFSYHFSELWF